MILEFMFQNEFSEAFFKKIKYCSDFELTDEAKAASMVLISMKLNLPSSIGHWS